MYAIGYWDFSGREVEIKICAGCVPFLACTSMDPITVIDIYLLH